jgi:hypothetical protein
LTAAGLVETLKGPGPFTVFAPTDEAFAKIGRFLCLSVCVCVCLSLWWREVHMDGLGLALALACLVKCRVHHTTPFLLPLSLTPTHIHTHVNTDQATLASLLADKEKLTSILTYHVVPGRVAAQDVLKLSSAATVQGMDM